MVSKCTRTLEKFMLSRDGVHLGPEKGQWIDLYQRFSLDNTFNTKECIVPERFIKLRFSLQAFLSCYNFVQDTDIST
jgi:hypothetical protein